MTFFRIIETLHPGYFDFVMANGILSIAAHVEGFELLGLGLTWLNVGLCAVLLAMNVLRFTWFRHRFLGDLGDFDRGPGFFTAAAGLAICGSQMLTILGNVRAAWLLWIAAITVWAVLNYAVFVELTVREKKPRFEKGINGGWLISVVAMQSIADLGARLSGSSVHAGAMLFLWLSFWLAGGMLYIWLIALIFYRFVFFRFRPESFLPPFWVNMGAMAISALAGTALAGQANEAVFLKNLLPFLQGLTVLFWATASWWIPMLAILAVWQHLVHNLNRPYSLLYWSAVFPLGMYTVATYHVSGLLHLPFLLWVPRLFVYLAMGSWLATAAAMLHSAVGKRGWAPPFNAGHPAP